MTFQRGVAVSCLRMSLVTPCATWRVTTCRCTATIVRWDNISPPPPLHQILWKQPSLSNKKTTTPRAHIHHRLCRPIPLLILVPPETLAGTAAILIIALRGIPLHERARGLTAVLRATLLPSPWGYPYRWEQIPWTCQLVQMRRVIIIEVVLVCLTKWYYLLCWMVP